MNEKKFLDEINLRIGDAQEGHTQSYDRPGGNPMLWKAKQRGLQDTLELYMKLRDIPEKFVSEVRCQIDLISQRLRDASLRGDRGGVDYWMSKGSALVGLMELYQECAAEPDDPPAPQEETFVEQINFFIEIANNRWEEALRDGDYDLAANLQVRRDTLKDILALYKRFVAEPQNHSAISK